MEIGSISKRNRILLMIVLPLALIMVFYSFYFNDNFESLNKLKNEAQTIKNDINRANQIIAKYEQIKAANIELQRKMEYLKTLLPMETEVSYVLRKVSEQGIQKGLQVTLWRPKGKIVHESMEIYEIPVEVRMKGKYQTFGSFFAEIAKIERIVNINSIHLKAGNIDDRGEIKLVGDPTNLNAELVVTTYSLIPEEEKKKLKEEKAKKQ